LLLILVKPKMIEYYGNNRMINITNKLRKIIQVRVIIHQKLKIRKQYLVVLLVRPKNSNNLKYWMKQYHILMIILIIIKIKQIRISIIMNQEIWDGCIILKYHIANLRTLINQVHNHIKLRKIKWLELILNHLILQIRGN